MRGGRQCGPGTARTSDKPPLRKHGFRCRIGTHDKESNRGIAHGFTATLVCPADLNSDDLLDDSDFVLFAAAYDLLDCADPAIPVGCPADLNGNSFMDDTGFVAFADAYSEMLCSRTAEQFKIGPRGSSGLGWVMCGGGRGST